MGDTFPRSIRPAHGAGLIEYRPPRPRGAHRRPRRSWGSARLVLVVIALVLGAAAGLLAGSGHARAATVPLRVRALEWAEAQAGKPYIYGGTGPAGFDCSGLVEMAWLHGAGIALPRTTYEMAADLRRLRIIPVADARRGDLLFFGTGHVELKTRAANGSFGALETGTRIGWHRWSGSWHPTFAMALR